MDTELLDKFQAVAQGPDANLLISLVNILYERITAAEYDDQCLSPEDLAAIQRGREDMQAGRALSLEEYRRGKRL